MLRSGRALVAVVSSSDVEREPRRRATEHERRLPRRTNQPMQLAMLTLELQCRDTRCGAVRTLRGLIALSASRGDVSDYWVSLLDARHRPKHRALLRGYPRWAESTRAFLARCLDAVLVPSDAQSWFPTDGCELTVTDWSTQSMVDCISFGDLRRMTPTASTRSALGRSGWFLMRWVCAQDAFGRQELPEPPMPVRPTIYESSGVKYCRTSDLPIEARVTFERLQSYLDRPFVPAVPDAVYPWWLESFLRNELPEKALSASDWR